MGFLWAEEQGKFHWSQGIVWEQGGLGLCGNRVDSLKEKTRLQKKAVIARKIPHVFSYNWEEAKSPWAS